MKAIASNHSLGRLPSLGAARGVRGVGRLSDGGRRSLPLVAGVSLAVAALLCVAWLAAPPALHALEVWAYVHTPVQIGPVYVDWLGSAP